MAHSEAQQIRLATALVILGTFVAGAFVGAGVYRVMQPPRPHPPPPMGLPYHELDVTAEQETKIDEITERHRGELEEIMRGTYPRVRAVQDQIEQEVRAVLTPAQQQRLDEIKARRPPRRGPPGEGPPGPPPPHEGRGGRPPPPPPN